MYRPCVGIMLINKAGLVFVGKRLGTGEGGGWQMPQGGIDAGEEPLEAAYRELEEETSVTSVSLLKVSDEWLSYDLPDNNNVFKGKYRGQTQKWVAFRFEGEDHEINLKVKHPEFETWKWVAREELPALIIGFKREVYKKIVMEFISCGR